MAVQFKCSMGHTYALALIDADKVHRCPFCGQWMNMYQWPKESPYNDAAKEPK
jgi:hypothetical protein